MWFEGVTYQMSFSAVKPTMWTGLTSDHQVVAAIFPKSRQHVCFVRRRIQMSDVGFVKIINIWCLSVQFGRCSMKSIREDCSRVVAATGAA